MSKNRNYLKHILDECEYVQTHLVEGDVTLLEFLENPTLKRAVVRSLEIIGEATKNISSDFRQKHHHIDWKNMAGMRDRLIHGYEAVDYELVWSITQENIPNLFIEIKTIFKDNK